LELNGFDCDGKQLSLLIRCKMSRFLA
jgi:hypothetical protein